MIIEGCFANWGAARAVLILATVRARFTVVLAEVVEREIQRSIARKVASLDPSRAEALAEGVASWLDRVRVERWPLPSSEEIRAQAPAILPVLRHLTLPRLKAGDSRDRRGKACEVERTPASPDLLDAMGLPGPNRSTEAAHPSEEGGFKGNRLTASSPPSPTRSSTRHLERTMHPPAEDRGLSGPFL